MNTYKKITAALSLGLVCNSAVFASDATLEVAGTLTPSACNMVLGLAGGKVDYGKRRASSLHPTQHTLLEPKSFPMNVTCAGPTQIALKLTDNRFGSEDGWDYNEGQKYGLGHAPMGAKIGAYLVELDPGVVDGLPGHLIAQSAEGRWISEDYSLFAHEQLFSWTQDASVPQPKRLTTLSTEIALQALIAGHKGMTFEEEIPLDGSAVMELIYL